MRQIISGNTTFENLRKTNSLYVDKTEYIWKLVTSHGSPFALMRPPQFGKSLTLSTLKALFEGKKELFEGLAIYDKYNWDETYPVIHMDFSNFEAIDLDQVEASLDKMMNQICEEHQVSLDIDSNIPTIKFEELIETVVAKSKFGEVVLLIDAYDKPVMDCYGKPNAEEISQFFTDFYTTIKSKDHYLRFALLTGVTKYYPVNWYSGLNTLNDISNDPEYAYMLGYTQSEFEEYFQEYIDKFKPARKSRETFLKEIKEWYYGFRFHPKIRETVYNPVTIARFFEEKGRFDNYWGEAETPSYLHTLAKLENIDIEEHFSYPTTNLLIKFNEFPRLAPINLLFQSGYITVKSVDNTDSHYYYDIGYWIGFCNRDVEEAFRRYFVASYTGLSENEVRELVNQLRDAITEPNQKKAFELLDSCFTQNSCIPSRQKENPNENTFQRVFYNIFVMCGFKVLSKPDAKDGVIDAVINLPDQNYIFEFKLNRHKTGMKQILEKENYKKYLSKSKPTTLWTINYFTDIGKIIRWSRWAVVRDDEGKIRLKVLPPLA